MDTECDSARVRVVIMGAEGVGKTTIMKRFLLNSFQHQHLPTLEDLYRRDFALGPDLRLRADFLDTSGSGEFPAMRRLAILSGQAFLLVSSLGCPASQATARAHLAEIQEVLGSLEGVPIVLAGNKADLRRTNGLFRRRIYHH